MMNYSVSGSGEIGIGLYNFTDAAYLGFGLNFNSPSAERGDIVRALKVTESKQIGVHVQGGGSLGSVSAQVTSVRLK